MTGSPRISVIVPTYQRGPLIAALIEALGAQQYGGCFEVIVVVDGSTDDTEARLAAARPDFPLRVITQPNRGLANARNRGAAAARGDLLLFLDDDMEPDPHLLAEHDRSQREGADVVAGAIPLHLDSPRNLLTDGVAAWADERSRRLAAPGYVPRFNEIVNGQVSIRRDVFERLGGFDERFTADGSYGNEDIDFGYRLRRAGYRVAFNPAAVSRQRYIVTAATHLRQYEQAGRADVVLARKYPELLHDTFFGELASSRLHRLARWPVLHFPRLTGWLIAPIRHLAVRRTDAGRRDPLTVRAFFLARAVRYWVGVHRAGGIPRHAQLRVLCYHAIADLAPDPILTEYGVPPERFREQLTALRRAGYHFVHPDEVARFVEGRGGLPRRAVLLTFDDCYLDLADDGVAILQELGVPSLAFAVSGRLGQVNDWDHWLGAGSLRLLDVPALAELPARGIEIGSHSRTHPMLPTLGDAALAEEVAGSARELSDAGLPAPRYFSYPHGEHDERVRAAVRGAGYVAAFTTTPGRVQRATDRYALPRVEMYPTDVGPRLRLKLASAGPLLRGWGFARRVGAGIRRRFREVTSGGGDRDAGIAA